MTVAEKIDAKLVKDLREKSGAPMGDCLKALQETKGNIEDAESGIASCEARSAPYSEAILPGATALPPHGLAALTNALDAVAGGGPIVNDIASAAGRGPLPEALSAVAAAPPSEAIGNVTMLLT